MITLSETLRSRWFSICLHVGLWVLLLLVIIGGGMGAHEHPFHEAAANPAAVATPVPVVQLERLLAPASYPKRVGDPATLSLFTTTYFVPPVKPTPPPPPPPPPPTTWKVELTYQGYYGPGEGPRYALLRLGEKLVGIPVGGMVVTNLFVVDAALKTLTLTNTAAQTNVLNLNMKQAVEVPIQ
jgi:hypothetical protein